MGGGGKGLFSDSQPLWAHCKIKSAYNTAIYLDQLVNLTMNTLFEQGGKKSCYL